VLVGYFALQTDVTAHLAGLLASSILLYVSGIVFNDFFDFDLDKRNRPSRPLPSGKVSKRAALAIAATAMLAGNIVALVTIGFAAFCVTLVLSAIIIAYDYALKSNFIAGTAAMSAARAVNVILGASPGLVVLLAGSSGELIADRGFQSLPVAASSVFFYVASIMLLSRTEETGASTTRRRVAMGIVSAIIAYVAVMGYVLEWDSWFFLMLGALGAVTVLTFSKYGRPGREPTQKIIRNMILSIIILDSIFIAATMGIVLGAAILLLLIPAILLGKRMYVT
jgi:4-hydroxybenzoate polyprenyltransferase